MSMKIFLINFFGRWTKEKNIRVNLCSSKKELPFFSEREDCLGDCACEMEKCIFNNEKNYDAPNSTEQL